MIRISKWLAGAAATVAILLGSADAEAQRGRPGGDSSDRPNPSEMFQRMDKNNDGELSKDELPEFIRDRIKGADADENGSLTKAEVKAFFEKNRGRPDGEGGRPGASRDSDQRGPDGPPPRREGDGRGPEGRDGDGPRRPEGPPPRGDGDRRGPSHERDGRGGDRGPGGPPHMNPGRGPLKGSEARRGPRQSHANGGPAQRRHKSRHAGKGRDSGRKSDKGRGPSARGGQGGRSFGPPMRGGRPSYTHRGPGPGGPLWAQDGHRGGPPFAGRLSFGRGPSRMGPPWLQRGKSTGRGPSFGNSRSGRPQMGPPWMHHRGPSKNSRGTNSDRGDRGRPGYGRPDHDGKPGSAGRPDRGGPEHGRRDGDRGGRPDHGPRPEGRGGRPEGRPQGGRPPGPPHGGPRGEQGDHQKRPREDRRPDSDRRPTRPEGEDRPERRKASVTAETETNVELAAEEHVEDLVVAEIEELQPVIDTAEQLPKIVPGLAVPESPALPEDGSTAVDEQVTTESAVESVDSVVETRAGTLATPE